MARNARPVAARSVRNHIIKRETAAARMLRTAKEDKEVISTPKTLGLGILDSPEGPPVSSTQLYSKKKITI